MPKKSDVFRRKCGDFTTFDPHFFNLLEQKHPEKTEELGSNEPQIDK